MGNPKRRARQLPKAFKMMNPIISWCLLVPAKDALSETSEKVYKYLLQVEMISKEKIIEACGLASQADYWAVRNELMKKGLAKAIRGRQGGLALPSSKQKPIQKEKFESIDQKRIELAKKIETLSPKAKKIWATIPDNGDTITNLSLMYKLRPAGIKKADYYKLRQELIDNGLVQRTRGRGGSVKRADVFFEEPKAEYSRDEQKLYDEVKKWLEDNVARKLDEGANSRTFVAVTYSPRKVRRDSGQWSRTDVMMISVNKYNYLPQRKGLTVRTYEVKPAAAIRDLTSVFEAASQQKGAHYAFLVFETSEDRKDDKPPIELSPTLERFGVGFAWLFKSSETGNYDMKILVEAARQNPAPEDENLLVEFFFNKLDDPKEIADFQEWLKP